MTQETAHMTEKQKRNGGTNGKKDIKSYNAPAFIANGSKTIKVSNYTHNKGQRPTKEHKEL